MGSLAFITALLLYAVFSAPFPANPGLTEVLIAGLLILFVSLPTGLVVMSGSFTLYRRYDTVPMPLHLGFFVLMWIGLLNGGIVYRWTSADILRDLIPCIYLFVPLLLLPAMNRSRLNWLSILPWLMSAMGVILSVRFYMEVRISPLDIGKMYYFDNFLYLPYDPSVTFAGVFLPIMAVHTWKSGNVLRWIASFAMLAGGFLALGSLMAVAQRAPLGLAVLSFIVYLFASSGKSVYKLLIGIIMLIGASYLAQEQISSSLELLVAKQQDYGANGKTDELVAVLQETSKSVYPLLLGIGWGGLFFDPTYQAEVSFTHSAFTFFLLKGGLAGLLIFLSYLGWITIRSFKKISLKFLPHMLAAGVPIMIGLLFQPSFKTLSYGMMLTVLVLLFNSPQARSES